MELPERLGKSGGDRRARSKAKEQGLQFGFLYFLSGVRRAEPLTAALMPFREAHRQFGDFQKVDLDKTGNGAPSFDPFPITELTDGAPDNASTNSSFFPCLPGGAFMGLFAWARPALRDDPATGIAAGYEKNFDVVTVMGPVPNAKRCALVRLQWRGGFAMFGTGIHQAVPLRRASGTADTKAGLPQAKRSLSESSVLSQSMVWTAPRLSRIGRAAITSQVESPSDR